MTLLLPLIFYVVLNVFTWLVDDAFSVVASDQMDFSCAFLRNVTYLADTPLPVRAACCAMTSWSFATWWVSPCTIALACVCVYVCVHATDGVMQQGHVSGFVFPHGGLLDSCINVALVCRR